MNDLVLYELRGSTCRITLNRPDKHNCIDIAMLRQLDDKVAAAGDDGAAKVVLVCGAGAKAFSSGGDLKAFSALSAAEIPDWVRLGNAVLNRLATIPKPTIAAIKGYAYGGGLELALACDFRIAAPEAKFSSPELKHGWVPGWGGLTRLRRLLGEAKAKEIALLGDVLDANEATRIGLVTKVVAPGSFEAELNTFVDRLAALDAGSFAAAKAVLSAGEISSAEVEFQVVATLMARGREIAPH